MRPCQTRCTTEQLLLEEESRKKQEVGCNRNSRTLQKVLCVCTHLSRTAGYQHRTQLSSVTSICSFSCNLLSVEVAQCGQGETCRAGCPPAFSRRLLMAFGNDCASLVTLLCLSFLCSVVRVFSSV